MTLKEYFGKIREYWHAFDKINMLIAENRIRNLERAANDGRLENFLKVATPVCAAISAGGIFLDNKDVASFGYGSLLMSGVYWFLLPKKS